MRRALWISLLIGAIPPTGWAQSLDDDLRAILQASCSSCHGVERPKGGLDLVSAASSHDVWAHAETWNRVILQVEAGFMPPPKASPLTKEEARTLIDGLRGAFASGTSVGAAPTLRRLNRIEYQNSVRDLLGVAFDAVGHLPDDARGYGFDNIGDTLFVSPLLIEKYVDATQIILDSLFASPASRVLVFGGEATPDPNADAGLTVLRRFMGRAFRRPPDEGELKERQRLVSRALEEGHDQDSGWRDAIMSVLLSPHFLFRVERRPAGEAHDSWPLDDWALATRLSYFLWSTMPDGPLMDLAREGRLRDPEVLAQEARRMLADPRSRALADQFGAQWLGFSDILDVAVDFRRFPGKFHEVRRSMYEEAARLFDDVVKGDHDVLRLLDADYTWLDARLAAHYGIPGVEGEEMRPVALTDRRRGGVLGMGAVLAPTAFPLRTSPTLRGKWILDNLLGIPPPPPPPDAGQLPSDDVQPDGLTLRERLERHRADRACAGCHARMDPLGYALENFDPTGRWRDTLQEKPIDNQGMLPDGTTVAGPVELRAWLLTRSDRFLGHLADRLFTYGVGRPAGPADRAMLASMAARVGARGRRMQDLIVEIVVSRPFRYRGG